MLILNDIPGVSRSSGDGPYAVCSWCDGSLMAYRCRTLEEAQGKLHYLSVHGCDAPLCLQEHELAKVPDPVPEEGPRVEDQFGSISIFEKLLADATKNASTPWEKDFVNNHSLAYEKYKGRTFLSDKQLDILQELQDRRNGTNSQR